MNTKEKYLRYRFFLRIAFAAAICTMALLGSIADAQEVQKPVYQLRIYQIFDSNKQAFHERFRDHAMRIMAKYDFKIVAMWESKIDQRTEFVYLLEWPDEETMKDRWLKFMADQEWSDIKKQTREKYGVLVGEIEDRVLDLTDYSPLPATGVGD